MDIDKLIKKFISHLKVLVRQQLSSENLIFEMQNCWTLLGWFPWLLDNHSLQAGSVFVKYHCHLLIHVLPELQKFRIVLWRTLNHLKCYETLQYETYMRERDNFVCIYVI